MAERIPVPMAERIPSSRLQLWTRIHSFRNDPVAKASASRKSSPNTGGSEPQQKPCSRVGFAYFGTAGSDLHFFAATQFTEEIPSARSTLQPTADHAFLAAWGNATYRGMAAADPQAVWVLDGARCSMFICATCAGNAERIPGGNPGKHDDLETWDYGRLRPRD